MDRKKLPRTRPAVTHKVKIAQPGMEPAKVYITVGLYEDGRPGEVFIVVGKIGSTLRGLLDVVGVQMSYALQYDLPFAAVGKRLTGMAFEPAGETDNPDIPHCSSIIDYVYRWMLRKWWSDDDEE